MSVRSFFSPLYRAADMRRIDDAAINTLGTPSLDLMERAGAEVARICQQLLTELDLRGTVVVLCGAGNNGGDGLVVASTLR